MSLELLSDLTGITLYNYLQDDCSEADVALFSQVTRNRRRGKGLKMCQGKFILDIMKNFFAEGVVSHWLSREVIESPSLEVSKETCRYGTSGHGLAGMVVLG